MIQIVVHNLANDSSKTYKINRMYDFDQIISDFGPSIAFIVGEAKSPRNAAEKLKDYLSNNHLEVEIIDPDDSDDIYDPNIETAPKKSDNPEKAMDLKDVLESYDQAEHVDIPEMHTLHAATHRWNK